MFQNQRLRSRFIIRRNRLTLPTRKNIIIPLSRLWVIGGLLSVAALIFVLFRSDLFRVHTIEVSAKVDCIGKQAVQDALGILDKSFFSVDQTQMAKMLTKRFLAVKSVSVLKKLPDTIILTVVCRETIIQMVTQEATPSFEPIRITPESTSATATVSAKRFKPGVFLVDDEGFVYARQEATSPGIAVLVTKENLSLGQIIQSKTISPTIRVLDILKRTDWQVQEVVIDDQELRLDVGGGFSIRYNFERQNQKLEALDLVLKKIKRDGRYPKLIDLRFDEPVLIY